MTSTRRLISAALILMCSCLAAGAAEKRLDTITARRIDSGAPLQALPRWTAPGRPSLALALSGGGARGIAHVGVLEALHEDGVELDGIAGTSFGALLGSFVCAGLWPDEVEQILRERNWNDILTGFDVRNRVLSRAEDVAQASPILRLRFLGHRRLQIGALVDSRTFERELYRYLLHGQVESGGDFDRLRYRFRPVATDVLTGRPVVPAKGDLVTAVRGSSAFPGLFRPVPFDDALLVDGGLVENIPVDSARSLGADLVVAVDVSEGIITDPIVKGALDLLNRSVNVLITLQAERLLERADLVLEPDVDIFSTSDFKGNVAELVQAGRAAYEASRRQLWSLLESHASDRSPVSYDRIEVQGTDWIDGEALAHRLSGGSGTVTRYRVTAELARALNLGPFSEGQVDWLETPSGRVLRFRFTESPDVAGVSVEGAPSHISDEEISYAVGQPFSLETARVIAWRSRQRLIDQGQVLVSLEELSWDPDTGTISIRVADAPVGQVSMVVTGNLRLEGIQRFLSHFQGRRFRYDQLADQLDELVARGVIFDWGLEPRMQDDGTVALQVQIRGDQYYDLAGALEYRDALGWAGHLRAAKSNITGHGDFVELTLAGALETEQAQVRYRTEYGIGFSNLGFEVGARFFNNEFPFVNDDQELDETGEERYEGSRSWVSAIRRLRWGAVARAGLFRERNRLEATPLEPEETRSRTSLFLRLDVDRHDHLLFPTRGGSLTIQGEHSISGQELWKYELFTDGSFSPGRERRHTVTGKAALGLSDRADRRPFWFDPGGHRQLYGFIPFGAAAPQYARLGATWRLRWFSWRALRVYLEAGADAIRTAALRSDLDDADTVYGYGFSVIAHTDFLGPIAVGAARNDRDTTTVFVTLGYGLFDR